MRRIHIIRSRALRTFAAAGIMLCFLWGCGGVEPEKRAYPLVVSIDIQEEMYQVIYGMANLSFSTGQNKSGDDAGQVNNTTLLFNGKDMQEILHEYDQTQENYLDLGHIQVFVFGKSLVEQPKRLHEVLQYLEQQPVLGDGACVFVSENPEEVMELNGSRVESLGTYLTGIYENRLRDKKEEMVTLQDIYRTWHNKGNLEIPALSVEEGNPRITNA